MNPSLNEKLIAYMALLSGLIISAVAIYYSVSGLTAIFAAATVPIIVMGVALELSKIVASIWLKQNWSMAPKLIKIYLSIAVALLMVITSMGIFGFLSKAHLDQNVPTANVAAQVALLDEKIKTERENIESARSELKQMSTTVDQAMSKGVDERGSDKAATVRRSQQRERATLMANINQSQQRIVKLNDERAPIAGNLRKVEAEVGPIKYIAAFFYGATDPTVLEKAVTWVIILIIVVFDPLALILLIASQVSFQSFKDRKLAKVEVAAAISQSDPAVLFGQIPDVVHSSDNQPFDFTKHPYLFNRANNSPPEITPIDPVLEVPVEPVVETEPVANLKDAGIDTSSAVEVAAVEEPQTIEPQPVKQEPEYVDAAPVPSMQKEEARKVKTKVFPRPKTMTIPESYVQNEEQQESSLWTGIATDTVNDIVVKKSK